MSTYWSTYVQESQELYASRALRFHDGNKDLWLKTLQIKNGMKVLEVGCGSGIFCHRIKKYLPDTDMTGLDFDAGHIEFAALKSAEEGLICKFVQGDATKLPFEENTFDICYSHTVMDFCEPDLFVKEQHRVLKPGGKMIILCVINSGKAPESWIPTDKNEEKELFDRLWTEAEKNDISKIVRYDGNVGNYFTYLQTQGFHDISADALAVVDYAPDSANTPHEIAVAQIEEDRLAELCSVKKARRLAPNALSDEEFCCLLDRINKRFDQRIDQYNTGIKLWDYHVGTVLAVSGTK